ncbi:MAG TPA: NAD(P)-dependent alcohol dehydrogenase [Phycicoccus sp.]|nr:NAD(P)-dependent alcohol dehydrogenase [Phycicoccus sp.]
MTTTPALSLPAAGAPFERVDLPLRELRDDDILIDIAYAGICHSDIHTGRDEWFPAHYPLTPGHEIAGTVAAVGPGVTRHQVGDRVGVGCLVDSCGECEWCKNGQEMFCTKPAVGTYNAQGYDGEWTAGGYAQQVVVSERFVLRIPDAMGLDVAAPLLCAGITTYSPLRRWGAGPGVKVAVVGVGGLGHMAVKIAAAMGAEVTTISRSNAKAEDALALGARAHLATSDDNALSEARGSFDLIINTVSAELPMDTYLRLLRPNGVMANVGLPMTPYSVFPWGVIGGNKVLTGSQIGGIPETQEMLDFCAEHGLGATIEMLDASDPAAVNDAWDRVVAGDVRYRVVIDTSTISAGSPVGCGRHPWGPAVNNPPIGRLLTAGWGWCGGEAPAHR